jgi:2-isopropylmalate synthase
VMDGGGTELSSAELWQLFEQEYVQGSTPLKYHAHHLSEAENRGQMIAVALSLFAQPFTLHGFGNGPIDAFLDALQLDLSIHHYEERSLTQGSDASAIAIVEMGNGEMQTGTLYGVGIHANIVTASLLAILSAVNRAVKVNPALKAKLGERFEVDSLSV